MPLTGLTIVIVVRVVVSHASQSLGREPGTRLGLWTHLVSQFSGVVFAPLSWYPFLVLGAGRSPAEAGLLMRFSIPCATEVRHGVVQRRPGGAYQPHDRHAEHLSLSSLKQPKQR